MGTQKRLNRIINTMLSGESAAHAYILEGRAGVERDRAIMELTAAITGDDANAVSMDVIRMNCSGKQGYKVEDAVDFIAGISMGAYGSCIVGIIDNAEMMSEAVQNKLLKTLEEPEQGTVIILATSNADNLISTVLSRCVTVKLEDDEEGGTEAESLQENVIAEAYSLKAFYQFRDFIEKNVKSREEALQLLGRLEDETRMDMIRGKSPLEAAASIELIEKTRIDIFNGMNYSKALKRLYLELA